LSLLLYLCLCLCGACACVLVLVLVLVLVCGVCERFIRYVCVWGGCVSVCVGC
jgi:hypothetical protein